MRSVLCVCGLVAVVWATFRLPLGERTLAGHLDRIAATPEAEELLGGARQSLAPVMTEASRRILGEYVEAPTFASTSAGQAPSPQQAPGAGPAVSPEQTAAPIFDARRFAPGVEPPRRRGARHSSSSTSSRERRDRADAPALPGT